MDRLKIITGVLLKKISEKKSEACKSVIKLLSYISLSENNTCVTHEEMNQLIAKVSNTFGKGIRGGIDNHTLPLWNMYTSVYFAITAVTTIGISLPDFVNLNILIQTLHKEHKDHT